MNDDNIVARILLTLASSPKGEDLATLKGKLKFQGQILGTLLWLNSMNFVEREELSTRYPVIRSRWRITSAGKAYLAFTKSRTEVIPYSSSPLQVLLVAPQRVRNRIKGTAPIDLYETLVDLLMSARNEVLISSPYIDEVIVPLLRNVDQEVRIRILTEDAVKPMFRRLMESRENTEVRYLRVMNRNVQLFQVHAKFACIDRASAIITSANFNERSLYYNVEVGVMISDPKICTEIAQVFEGIFGQASEI